MLQTWKLWVIVQTRPPNTDITHYMISKAFFKHCLTHKSINTPSVPLQSCSHNLELYQIWLILKQGLRPLATPSNYQPIRMMITQSSLANSSSSQSCSDMLQTWPYWLISETMPQTTGTTNYKFSSDFDKWFWTQDLMKPNQYHHRVVPTTWHWLKPESSQIKLQNTSTCNRLSTSNV